MSAPLDSLSTYFAYLYLQRVPLDPDSREWKDLVEANPFYAWFMAGLARAKEGTGTAVFLKACLYHIVVMFLMLFYLW